ncbi:hypothetical protein MTsN3n11_28830 [Qipengyuania sp. MTN3-11]
MTPRILAPISLIAVALSGCATMDDTGSDVLGSADVTRSDGTPAGTVRLMESAGELVVTGTLSGLPAGEHGFHLHTTGRCDAPDFQSAGGHLNPYDRDHGKLDPQGKHLGDLDNITVPASGMVTISQSVGMNTNMDIARIFDADGTSVMVHSGPDDYRTDPSGDAGSRIACGVMRATG